MTDDPRQLARDILSGKITTEELQARQKARAESETHINQSADQSNTETAPSQSDKQQPVISEEQNSSSHEPSNASNESDEPPPVSADQQPEQKPPVMTRTPPDQKLFPCRACGAKLNWDPSVRALKCPYCGYVENIDPSNNEVREQDFAAVLEKQVEEKATLPDRPEEIHCPSCGAIVLLEANVRTDQCPFCATHLENAKPEQAHGQIVPHCVLPFGVSQKQAVEAFNNWIQSRWFAPNDLKRLANLGQLNGVYVPYWTYDSMTYTHYAGMRGDDYWVSQTYTTTVNGKTVTRTRMVRRTRWRYVSGEVDHFFDDVLVCASRSLPANLITTLEPWDLKALKDFRGEYLAGFRTERYTVTLGDGFGVARQMMDGEIRVLCMRDIGGDHQRLNNVDTQHVGVTFKHILLPIWLAVYRYRDQTYRILVNARTGEVVGTRPYSAWKITFLILAILAAIAVIVTIIVINN